MMSLNVNIAGKIILNSVTTIFKIIGYIIISPVLIICECLTCLPSNSDINNRQNSVISHKISATTNCKHCHAIH